MSLVIDSSAIKAVVGASGSSIADKIVGGTSGTVFWQEEQYIYQSGTLLSGVSLDGFTNTGSTLYRNIEADRGENPDYEESGWATVDGIDLTDYAKMDITLTYNASVGHGDAYFQYGIDGLTNTVDTSNGDVTTTFTLDISGLTGTHALQFYLYARNESSEPTWGAGVTLNISSIRLYN